MEESIKKSHSQVQLWSFLGPLLAVCVLFMSVLRSSTDITWSLSLIAIIGLLMCYKWHWQGMIAASAFLISTVIFLFSSAAAVDWLWTIALATSIIATFVLTTLSSSESFSNWDSLSKESENRREAITLFNDRLQNIQNKAQLEKQQLKANLDELQKELIIKNEQAGSQEKLIHIIKEEIAATHSYQEKLLQELYESRQEIASLEHQLAEKPKGEISSSDSSLEVIERLQGIIESHNQEIATLHFDLDKIVTDKFSLENQKIQLMAELEAALKSNKESHNPPNDQILQQTIMQELNNHIDTLTMEKQLLEATLTRLQAELEFMNIQRQDDLETIETHQLSFKNLKLASEKHENMMAQERVKTNEIQQEYEKKEQLLQLKLEEMVMKWSQSSQQLIEWQKKVADYAALNEKLNQSQLLIEKSVQESQQFVDKYEILYQEHQSLQEKLRAANQQEEQLTQYFELQKAELAELRNRENEFKTQLIHFEELQQDHQQLKHLNVELEEKYLSGKAHEEHLQLQIASLNTQQQLMEDHQQKNLKEIAELLQISQKRIEAHDQLQNEFETLHDKFKKAEESYVQSTLFEQDSRSYLDVLKRQNEIEKENYAFLQADYLAGQKELQKLTEQIEKQRETIQDQSHHKEMTELLAHEKQKLEIKLLEAIAQRDQLIHTQELNTIKQQAGQSLENLQKDTHPSGTVEERRLKGLHKQLNEQFIEKNHILKQTRRELFNTQEALSSLQKDIEESTLNSEVENDLYIAKILAAAESEISEHEKTYENEVKLLHHIIDNLMRT